MKNTTLTLLWKGISMKIEGAEGGRVSEEICACVRAVKWAVIGIGSAGTSALLLYCASLWL